MKFTESFSYHKKCQVIDVPNRFVSLLTTISFCGIGYSAKLLSMCLGQKKVRQWQCSVRVYIYFMGTIHGCNLYLFSNLFSSTPDVISGISGAITVLNKTPAVS